MFQVEIKSAQNNKIVKTKYYQTDKSLNVWLPKLISKYGKHNNIIVFDIVTGGKIQNIKLSYFVDSMDEK